MMLARLWLALAKIKLKIKNKRKKKGHGEMDAREREREREKEMCSTSPAPRVACGWIQPMSMSRLRGPLPTVDLLDLFSPCQHQHLHAT